MNPAEVTPFWQKLVSASTRANKEGFSRWARSGPGRWWEVMFSVRHRRSWAWVTGRRISSMCKWCARRLAAEIAVMPLIG